MTFTSKAEADAYDKMLDMADELFGLLDSSDLLSDDQQKEDLSLFLAQRKEDVLVALGAKRKAAPKAAKKKPSEAAQEAATETQDNAADAA